jgi:hypothetical protein
MVKLSKTLSHLIWGGVTIVTLTQATPARAISLLHTFSNPGQVGEINTSTGVFTPLITNAPQLTDIALSENRELFGITFDGLYKLDTTKKTVSLIGNLGLSGLNGLGFDKNNNLYGTGRDGFYKIDTSTGAATLVNRLSNFASAGDIVFNPDTNSFLGTSRTPNNSTLFSISLDGRATEIGNIGFNNVYGIFFEEGKLFGYTADRKQIDIDIATGLGTFNRNISGTTLDIGGAASLPSTGPTTPVPEPTSILGLLTLGTIGAVSRMKQRK